MNNNPDYEPSFRLFSAEFGEKESQYMLPYAIDVFIIAESLDNARKKLTAYLDSKPKELEDCYILDEVTEYLGVYLQEKQYPSVFLARSLNSDSIILF